VTVRYDAVAGAMRSLTLVAAAALPGTLFLHWFEVPGKGSYSGWESFRRTDLILLALCVAVLATAAARRSHGLSVARTLLAGATLAMIARELSHPPGGSEASVLFGGEAALALACVLIAVTVAELVPVEAVRRAVLRTEFLIPVVVIGTILVPLLLTERSVNDWTNHLWLLYAQGRDIEELGHPSYFLQSNLGAFLPWYAFYGGTMYAAGGLLSVVIGAIPAYVVLHVFAVGAAYGGFVWLGKLAGIRGWWSHVPAILFVTSSYYVTNLYGRGATPEAFATSMIPLVIAGAIHLTASERWTFGPVAAYVAAVIMFTGSHSLTLVWGATFIAAVLTLMVVVAWSRRPSRRRVGAVFGVTALAGAVNLWFVLPLLAYSSRVAIGDESASLVSFGLDYTDSAELFSVLRDTPQPLLHTIQAQLPVLVIVWGILAFVVVARSATRATRNLTVGLVAILVAVVVLLLSPGLIEDLPGPWGRIQFPYRLVTYATLAASGIALVLLRPVQELGSPKRVVLAGLLVITTAISCALALDQVLGARSLSGDRSLAVASATSPPPTWDGNATFDYADATAPVVTPTIADPLVVPTQPGSDRVSVSLPPGTTGTVQTNVAAGPYLVDVAGAEPVGRTEDGFMIVEVRARAGEAPRVTFSAKTSALLGFGKAVTILALIGTGVLLAMLLRRSRRARGTGTT
jgi:hypothetical protein